MKSKGLPKLLTNYTVTIPNLDQHLEFVEQKNGHCLLEYEQNIYNSFEDAKTACSKDDSCVGIDIYPCNPPSGFNLCKKKCHRALSWTLLP